MYKELNMTIPMNVRVVVNKKKEIGNIDIGTLAIKAKSTPVSILYLVIAWHFFLTSLKEFLGLNK